LFHRRYRPRQGIQGIGDHCQRATAKRPVSIRLLQKASLPTSSAPVRAQEPPSARLLSSAQMSDCSDSQESRPSQCLAPTHQHSEFTDDIAETRQVASRPIKARNKPKLHWIGANAISGRVHRSKEPDAPRQADRQRHRGRQLGRNGYSMGIAQWIGLAIAAALAVSSGFSCRA
jgi:hypothetical protein